MAVIMRSPGGELRTAGRCVPTCVAVWIATLFLAAPLAAADGPVFATFLGGSGPNLDAGGGDLAAATATDPQGNIYVAGQTTSADFPVRRDKIY